MRLTRDEMLLLVAVLSALVLGALVKSYRDSQRLLQTAPAAEMNSEK